MTAVNSELMHVKCNESYSFDSINWNLLYLDVRLRAANRIIELSWRERKTHWERKDIGAVMGEVLRPLVDVPLDQIPSEALKELLRHVYLGACDVIPDEMREF